MTVKSILQHRKMISACAILFGSVELLIYPGFLSGIVLGYLFIPLGIAQIVLGIFLIIAWLVKSFKLIREALAYITAGVTLVATSGLLLILLLLGFLYLTFSNSGIH